VGLTVSNQMISRERAEALGQSDEAKQQRKLARQAVDKMFTQVAEKWLAHQTGVEPLQRQFLEDALGFYEKLIDDRATTPDELLEAGNAYQRMGQVQHKLGQSVVAEHSFAQSQAILEKLVDSSPAEPEYRAALAASFQHHGGRLLFDDPFSDAHT